MMFKRNNKKQAIRTWELIIDEYNQVKHIRMSGKTWESAFNGLIEKQYITAQCDVLKSTEIKR